MTPNSYFENMSRTSRKTPGRQTRDLPTDLSLQASGVFRIAFEFSPAMQSLVRADDGRIVAVNDSFLKTFGFAHQEVIGLTAAELDFWVHSTELADYGRELEENGFVSGREVSLRGAGGRTLTVLLSTHSVEIDGGRFFLSAGVDITRRKEIEATLRLRERQLSESEAQIRALYESISAAVVVHDENGFLQVNSATVRLFRASGPEQIIGLHPGDTSPPTQPDGSSSDEAARRHISRAMKEGTTQFEWTARRFDGSEVPLDITLTTLPLEGRTVVQAVMNDLTDRKKTEEGLKTALLREKELNQLKSEFVSLVSHEFRTPLEIIMSSADNLERYQDRLSEQKRSNLLQSIHKAVHRMAVMMEDVLALGRVETDSMTFRPVPIEPRQFFQRICDELQTATGNRCPIELVMDGVPGIAIGDESLLRHVFTNLLSNAVKFSPSGAKVALSIHREKNDTAVCRITDHGCGIPEQDRPRLFQAFSRGSNVKGVTGTGLGLLIVQRCVELHLGEIDFESVEGCGTTFTVRLPLFPEIGFEADLK